MDIGFFTMPIHPVGRSIAETLQEDRELALVADRLGFTEGLAECLSAQQQGTINREGCAKR